MIKKDGSLSTEEELVVRINNGDFEALKRLQKLWKLKDEESTISYAIGILRLAETNQRVLIEPVGADKPVLVTPGDKLLAEPDNKPQAE